MRGLLASGRLVTLTGPGGVGKTRLALAAAAAASDAFPDGVWLIELAAETARTGDTADVAAAVADVLGIRDHAAGDLPSWRPEDRLAHALGTRRLLLVLDNCEHVVQPVADLAESLLRHAPGLRILATSREPLTISGETLHAVEPLRESDAVQLFAARAAAAAPGFALGPANADAVALVCERLDGIPLALELAAARVRALGVHELAERLRDRFRLLNAGRRDAPARHQTLRAVIDWSWGLLTDSERSVLRRLAVFSGGCTLPAAEEVCAAQDVPADDVLDVVTRLVDRSLVTVLNSEDGPRYRMLESIAAYSLERLDEAGETRPARRRHRIHYTELAERAEPWLYGPDQRCWLRRLDSDSANLRSALADATSGSSLDGGADGDADLAVRQVNALAWYWFLRGRMGEARRSFDLALGCGGLGDDGPALDRGSVGRSSALARQAGFALLAGDHAQPKQPNGGEYDAADPRARWFLAHARCGFAGPSEEIPSEGLRRMGSRRPNCWPSSTPPATPGVSRRRTAPAPPKPSTGATWQPSESTPSTVRPGSPNSATGGANCSPPNNWGSWPRSPATTTRPRACTATACASRRNSSCGRMSRSGCPDWAGSHCSPRSTGPPQSSTNGPDGWPPSNPTDRPSSSLRPDSPSEPVDRATSMRQRNTCAPGWTGTAGWVCIPEWR